MKNFSPINRRHWLQSSIGLIAGWQLHTRVEAKVAPTISGPARLALNENPFGPAPSAIAAMEKNLSSVFRYAGSHTNELTKAIAKKEGVPEDHVLLGVGSAEILQAVGLWIGSMKGEVVTAVPGYLQLVDAARSAGAKIVSVPVNDRLEHDLPAMASHVNEATKLVYICNPNNPTGTLVNPAELKKFVRDVSARTPVFIDEAYLECADDFHGNTMAGLVRDGLDVIVSRTFSKIHGLAGQRIGYALMKPALAAKVSPLIVGNMAMNLLGVVAATASLKDQAYLDATRRIFIKW